MFEENCSQALKFSVDNHFEVKKLWIFQINEENEYEPDLYSTKKGRELTLYYQGMLR